jgi:tetratricopeptide (TPR) repeat protein
MIRSGNKLYEKKQFSDAEIEYKKALSKKNNSKTASYNLGNALYKQDKFDEAINNYSSLASQTQNKEDISKYYYNIGNSYLRQNKFEESIDAYKKSLLNNPKDMAAKYNLSLAQRMMKEKPKQQQNKDKNKDQQNKDKNDKKDKNDQNNDQDKKQNQDQQQQPQSGDKIDKNAADQMLQAVQNDESNTQKDLEKKKAAVAKSSSGKNW